MGDEDRTLKENRRLKEENRSLKKLVKKLSKGNKRLEDLEEWIQDSYSEEIVSKKNSCIKCKKGELLEIELGSVRKIIKCSNCNHRAVIKLNGNK